MPILEGWSVGWQLTASALCAALLIALIWASYLRNRRHNQLPPGPWPLPVLGNLLHLSGDLPHVRLARLAERHGPLMGLRLGSKPTVVASSAQVAREFLQTHDRAFASRPPSLTSDHLFYGQAYLFIMAPYGPYWRHLRKIATLQLLSARRVQQTQPLRRQELVRVVQSLASDAAASVAVDLTRAMSTMVEDLIYRIIFRSRASDAAPTGGAASLIKDLMHKSATLFQAPVFGDIIPWLGFLDRGVKRRMDEVHTEFDAVLEPLVMEREKQHQVNILQGRENLPEDILDELLLDPSLSRVGVKQCVLDLIAAGVDTTSVTLDWTMAELFNNPRILKKLQAEVEKVVGLERMVEDSDIVNLPYVAAIVKETLRLHPPLSLLLPHMASEACKVMGHNVPDGTRLWVNAWAIGRDPATWEDPERFWPERFVKQAGDQVLHSQHDEFSWIPFGSGRRSCPGSPLALPTLELTIANLVHCFDWRLADGQSHVDMSTKASAITCRQHPLLATPTLRISLIHSE